MSQLQEGENKFLLKLLNFRRHGWRQANFEDCSNRLNGGNSNYGGLSDFNWNWSGNRWYDKSFRPLEVLSIKQKPDIESGFCAEAGGVEPHP
ncbi:MAG: hypothetical protein AAB556_01060 [Patescibacteria group bacterium]